MKKVILKSKQIFIFKKHNLFTEEVNKIALSAKNDKKINQLSRDICI